MGGPYTSQQDNSLCPCHGLCSVVQGLDTLGQKCIGLHLSAGDDVGAAGRIDGLENVTLGFWQVDVNGRLAGSVVFLSPTDPDCLTPVS